jgi:hypothetical protein
MSEKKNDIEGLMSRINSGMTTARSVVESAV